MRRYTFDPDWVIAPGETLADHLEEIGSSVAVLSDATELPPTVLEGIIAGTEPITEEIAAALAKGTGIGTHLWLNLERAYRQGLAQGKQVL